MSDATIHQLAEHRAARRGTRPPAVNPEAADWALLGERADAVLAAADAAIRASSRWRPGLYALRDELAGLRFALQAVNYRRLAVEAIWDEAYSKGAADYQRPGGAR